MMFTLVRALTYATIWSFADRISDAYCRQVGRWLPRL